MRKVKINDLNTDVQSFFGQIQPGDGVTLEDAAGLPRYAVLPLRQPTPQERKAALERVQAVQRRVRQRMEIDSRTEDELDDILYGEE